MMANPEMSSTQEQGQDQGLVAVPPQGRPVEADPADSGETAVVAVEAVSPPEAVSQTAAVSPAEAARPRRAPAAEFDPEPESRLPLMARVLLSDLAIAVIGLIFLVVIEVQRMGEASLPLRRRAFAEDLVVLFAVTAILGLITFFLFKARHVRVAVVQAVVTALVLTVAVTSAATGNPQPTPTDEPAVSVPTDAAQ
jgi:hypothetical protein